MIKFAKNIGLLAAVFSFSASAQTVQLRTLDQAGAESVLQAAKENAKAQCAFGDCSRRFRRRLAGFRAYGRCAVRERGTRNREGTNGCGAAAPDAGGRGQHQSRQDGLRYCGHHVATRRHANLGIRSHNGFTITIPGFKLSAHTGHEARR
jgi:hypothetical protein